VGEATKQWLDETRVGKEGWERDVSMALDWIGGSGWVVTDGGGTWGGNGGKVVRGESRPPHDHHQHACDVDGRHYCPDSVHHRPRRPSPSPPPLRVALGHAKVLLVGRGRNHSGEVCPSGDAPRFLGKGAVKGPGAEPSAATAVIGRLGGAGAAAMLTGEGMAMDGGGGVTYEVV
jgi:hypothetical protein